MARLKPIRLSNSPKRRILLVDDNVEVRTLYAGLLRGNGYRVALAGNAKEAIRKASVLAPDLILMDLSMPGTSGIEATKQLKRDDDTNKIPVLMLTAYVLEPPQLEALTDLGALGYISKLASPQELLRAVKSASERHSQ